MKVIGKMIFNMDMAKSFGLITQGMRESTVKGKNKVKGYMCGVTEANIMEIGKKI